jgi:feruloyl esterase
VLWVLAASSSALAAQPPAALTDAQCEALVQADFSQVEDAPAKVITAKLVAGAGDLPGYCEVIGYAWRAVQFRVRMPVTGWNGKLAVFGTGGQAGDFMPDDPKSPVSWSGSALRQGFATAAHNGGHLSSPTDAQWAYQNESAMLDYGFRAPHVAGLAARAVVLRTYGQAARHVYFSGCSNGGREALQMAQRYPYDYDGIIAGAPSMRWSDLFPNLYWFANRMYGSNAVLDGSALQLLHRYVLDRCDRIDGKLDGILDDPRKCQVDLGPITCRAGASPPGRAAPGTALPGTATPGAPAATVNTTANSCLTPAQARAAREIYDGPRDGGGRPVAHSSAMPGSELVWGTFADIARYPVSVFRYQSFMPAAGATFVPDESRLGEYVRRSGGSDAILSATNPDLRRFRDNGGKLLSYMGWNDAIGDVRETIDYYSTVERVIGGREATQEFYRLFMVPGMNHCSGGDGASQIDWLAALDGWVDQRKAPDTITGYHPDADGKPAFVRTVAPLVH